MRLGSRKRSAFPSAVSLGGSMNAEHGSALRKSSILALRKERVHEGVGFGVNLSSRCRSAVQHFFHRTT